MNRRRNVMPMWPTPSTLLTAVCFTLLFFAGQFLAHADGPRYLKYNIHAQEGPRDAKASYANWTDPGAGHFIIPVNTKIVTEPYRKGFIITDVEKKKEVYFEYNAKYMKMSQEDYIKLITSAEPVSLDGLSSLDQKGVKEGKARIGMSKKGIMAALGYPCAVATASPEENIWTYWRNRWKKTTVEFDEAGFVKEIK